MNNDVQVDKNLLLKAEWELKTENLITKNIVRTRISQIRQEAQNNLEVRRQRLAALMNQEEGQYQKEFHENLETPEQVRQRMAKRLVELKKKREAERKDLVEHLNERRFRDTTDDLRKEDAKFYTQQCAIERENQLREKRRKMEADIQEEMLYAEMCRRDIAVKDAREKAELEEKERLKKETLDVLGWQKVQNLQKKQNEQVKAEAEKEMLNQQWEVQALQDVEAQKQQLLINKERNLEIIRHNELEKQIREAEAQREKERDKEMIDKTVNHEQAIAGIEFQEKEQRRQEAKELQKAYIISKQDGAAAEKETE